jgi:hypothetical protein
MVRIGRKLLREQQGSSIVLMGLSLTLLLTVAGLVVDGGTMYATKSHLQKSANAAALSGAQALTRTDSEVKAIVGDILQHHGEESSLTGTDVQMNSTVRVHLSKKVPLGFSRLFSRKDVTVQAQAAAQLAPIGIATGVAPIGVDENLQLEYYKPYTLKFGPKGGENGFRGILELGGHGANVYGYNLKYGYQGEVKIGDPIDTKGGVVTGKTAEGVNYRIETDPYPPGEYWHKDSPRVMLIPVYKDSGKSNGTIKQVEVTGFAYFYLLEPMVEKDKEIRGMFIERYGGGSAVPGAVNRGAYAIRLVE